MKGCYDELPLTALLSLWQSHVTESVEGAELFFSFGDNNKKILFLAAAVQRVRRFFYLAVLRLSVLPEAL